jgi:protein phosphatase
MSVMTPRDGGWTSGPAPRSPIEAPAHAPDATVTRETTHATAESRVDVAVASLRGSGHAINEDAYSLLDRRSAVYVVADGVGGGAMAARASRELVARLHERLDSAPPNETAVRLALLEADRGIARSIAQHTDATGAATVALCRAADAMLALWIVAWVGDCRVYLLRGGAAELVTRDDTYRNLGETPPAGGSPDDPARMVGNGAVGRPNVISVTLGEGETLVLASDGVHKHVGPGEIVRALDGDGSAARGCVELVERARRGGSRDDATVLAVRRARRMAQSEAGEGARRGERR